ncbi:MAG: helix-turn-helix transcriptional regulator [Ktedonobacteraceae bacterium]|nr:helix-turn-helix transcriptional regulator [Ktedonobacteraceae bacterium]
MSRKEMSQQLRLALGQALRNYRTSHALKQKEMAELLCIDERTLRRWESGEISQRVDDLMRIADVLGLDYEQLGVSSSLSLPRTLAQIDEDIEQVWASIKQACYMEARTLVENLIRDLTLQITTEDSLFLHGLARAYHAAGYVTSIVLRTSHVHIPLQHYQEMERLAHLVKDDTLLNIALTYEGDMLRRRGDIQAAIQYLEAARTTTPQADMLARGNGIQLLGRAYLSNKDTYGFERALAEAEEIAGTVDLNGSTRGQYNLGTVYEEYGKGYGSLGDMHKGMEYLKRAEQHLPATQRWELVLKTARAMTLVRGGEISEGANLAIEAAMLCHQIRNYRMLERIYLVQNYLEQLVHEVGQVTASLREVLHGPVEHI